MPYAAQIVKYLDGDLEPTAKHIANKPGNTTASWGPYSGSSTQSPGGALSGVGADFRLVIVGHGDPQSTSIGNNNLSAKKLAEVVSIWLGGTKIKRISLHMCHGGGNRGSATGADVEQFTVRPQNSFAAKFASYCGQLTQDVTARTDSVAGTFTENANGGTTSFKRTVGGRHKALGDKLVFTTNPQSTLNEPKDATRQFVWVDVD
ncbi:hypothetical protein [Aquabacterium sp.]|uniref:hypothetical protein n=1 Tax=Aquabacterium sp. TaxID=1872578 RepID=UPI0024897642|nr:hypothetical protein [Aquabacterium sp.]MDI1260680.1 hypothetical protein [Aquabacterium sp.]